VSAKGVARRFAGKWALRGVTLSVACGEVVAIRGSNGSGKSTFLRIIASALRLTRGECLVFGHDVASDARQVRPLVGLLGHAASLYQDLTVAENLLFAARMACIASDPRTIDAAIHSVGLERAANERARNLSSGMQRRVALARLTMRSPKLLLLDEPYNSLDDDGVAIVDRLVQDTRDAGGATVLVTHDADRAGRIADCVVTMDDGMLFTAATSALPRAVSAVSHAPLRLAHEASR
jgi:heme exporter protein A